MLMGVLNCLYDSVSLVLRCVALLPGNVLPCGVGVAVTAPPSTPQAQR